MNCKDQSNLLLQVGKNVNSSLASQDRADDAHHKLQHLRIDQITPKIFNDRVLVSEPQKLKMSKLLRRQDRFEFDVRISDFRNHVEQNLKVQEQDPLLDVRSCLGRHNINGTVRARMVDWMTDVLF